MLFTEDFAQDKKEYQYLSRNLMRKNNSKAEHMIAADDNIQKAAEDLAKELTDILDSEGFPNCEVKLENDSRTDRFYIKGRLAIYKDDAEIDSFNLNILYVRNSSFLDRFAYNLFKHDDIYNVHFYELGDHIQKYYNLDKAIRKEAQPFFDKLLNSIKVKDKVVWSRPKEDEEAYKAYSRAVKSYGKEYPVAPGNMARWQLQNGDSESVEVLSVDDKTNTAKVKTDGGAVKKVSLSRLSPDSANALES